MKVVLISDTHSLHDRLIVPSGDIIIHAGDVSANGSEGEVLAFLDGFSSLNYKHKVFIAGNHDFSLEKKPSLENKYFSQGVIYLQNSLVEIDGLKIYGSPYTPSLNNWAFVKSKLDMKKEWGLIPNDLDILITHNPPYKIMDSTIMDGNLGCQDLLKKILEVKPRIHVFGHVHEGYGTHTEAGFQFFNASVVDEHYEVVNAPILIDLLSK